jgi:hypothetical protein
MNSSGEKQEQKKENPQMRRGDPEIKGFSL